MAISNLENSILKSLIKLEKRISTLYRAIEKDDANRENYIQALLSLISKENELLLSIDLNANKLETIESELIYRMGCRINTVLPLGITQYINDQNYPYYRLVARLRYTYSKQVDSLKKILDPYLLDNELTLFHRILTTEAEKDSVNPQHKNRLIECSRYLLMNSPTVECEVLRRDLSPVEYVDDCIEFHTTLLYWAAVQKLKDAKHLLEEKELKEYSASEHILNNERSTQLYRTPRFLIEYAELLELLKTLIKNNAENTPEFTILIGYLKTQLALLDRGPRQTMYEALLSHELSCNHPWLKNLFQSSFKDIEENLVSHIRKISLNPTYKMN